MSASLNLDHYNKPVKALDYAAFQWIVNPEDVNPCQFFYHDPQNLRFTQNSRVYYYSKA
jgi:hypothetical protein